MITNKLFLGLWAFMAFAQISGKAYSHELPENRIALVVRDSRVVNLTLYLNVGGSLHQSIAPQMPWKQFIAIRAAMPDLELDIELRKFIANIQNGTILQNQNNGTLVITSWKWPDFKLIQAQLRRMAMDSVISNSSHAHEEPIQITAQSISKQNISEISIKVPSEIKPVTVVAYEPQQFRMSNRNPEARFVFKP
jgi:hypothetical protein